MTATSTIVLYVEDDSDLRETVADALQDFGFEVKQAEHGRAALSMLDAGLRPLAIVTDLMMPQMSGWELITQVRRTPALEQMPIIVMSAVATSAPLNVEAVLAKPIDIGALELELHRIRQGQGPVPPSLARVTGAPLPAQAVDDALRRNSAK